MHLGDTIGRHLEIHDDFNAMDDATKALANELKNREKAMTQNADNPYPRYTPDLETIEPDMEEILIKAGVPQDQLKAHITNVVSRFLVHVTGLEPGTLSELS